MNDEPQFAEKPGGVPRFFQSVDWASFGITTLVALTVFCFTLAPDVGLEDSGHFAVSSAYLGVPDNPGFPVWTVYSWLFTKLPFSNIAWRLALASAVAGALTCGTIALMVARVGGLAAENVFGFKNLSPKEEKSIRVVCGCIAGLGFGFDGCFWPKTVIVDPWPLSLFLFTLTLCLLTRWFFTPQRRRCLYAASFIYGLALCNSQSLLAAAFGLPFLVAMADCKIGREIFFWIGIFLWCVLDVNSNLHWFNEYIYPPTRNYLIGAAVIFTLMWIVLSVQTHRFFSEWKATSICATLFLLGISAYFLLPIFSMANPPMNWGYPRTVEGFFHVITRGQYERINPTNSFANLVEQLGIYGRVASDEFGLPYLLAAVIPFCLLHKISSPTRRWLVGLLVVWFFASLLMLAGLNLSPDRSSVELIKPFFAASHLMLAVFAGCGLMLLAVFFTRPATAKSRN
jgi:hypothetical protein